MDKGYIAVSRVTPKTLASIYNSATKKTLKEKRKTVVETYGPLVSKKLGEYVASVAPDAIVCTHVFAGMFAAYCRERGHMNQAIKLYGIVTDFTIHPFWEECNLDYFVLASKYLSYQARMRGIPQEKLLPIGIPIKPKFMKSASKQQARQELGIADKRTVLIMRGSFGFGKIIKDIERIDKMDMDLQLLVICGSNVSTFKKLKKHSFKKEVHIYEFVDNIDVMMDASDVIITKPGGLSTSECMAKRLPMILMNPIPGVEDRNLVFFMNHGLALEADAVNGTVDEAIDSLFSNPGRMEELQKKYCEFGKPYAGRDLIAMIKKNNEQKLTEKAAQKQG